MKSKRLTWEEYALEIANVASLRSEDPYVKVGACGLNKENRVIGVSYNGLASGKIVEPEFWTDRNKRRPFMIHAEANLLSLFSKNECHLLACTLLPCSSCASLIAANGIKKVVYRDLYDYDMRGLEIFDFYNIEHKQIKL
jgi:dCMP deaminase